ncbi:hypothetical protein WBP07_14250 [Novosphingobium sp. BL-8A]|uniref:hypothetical protein n=1 Tax=Novosphingobium sp. BL-8A TaxID=3127639 RepID=UPI0037565575
MEKIIAPRSPRAITAIAAVLALAATPALAQEAGTQPAIPEAATPAPPVATPPAAPSTPPSAAPATPSIVLPTTDAAPQAPAPVQTPTVQQPAATLPATPDTEAAAPATPTAVTATAKPVTPRTERVTRATAAHAGPARVPTATDVGTAGDGALARGDAPPPVAAAPRTTGPAAPVATAPTPAPTPVSTPAKDNTLPVEGVIGLLAALGVAGAGVAVMLRRRRKEPEEEYVEGYVDDFAEPEPSPIAMADPMALPTNPPARLGPSSEALAAGPVPLGDDRRELLEAMVAAEPDEANPFTSRKARMRRARLILQHREHLQTQGKPFDWRTYRPTTRPSNPTPTETLVEA